jgi:hypothetical protein
MWGMIAESGRSGAMATVGTASPQGVLDYYLIFPDDGGDTPDGIVVEEFVMADDCTATALNSAGWTAADGGWWSSAVFSRGMRGDAQLRARVVPVHRGAAEIVYSRSGAGELPDEATLRTYFHEQVPLGGSAPLLLDSPEIPDGFQDKRVYRILFIKELDADGLSRLQTLWQLTLSDDVADLAVRVVGTANLRLADDAFTWELRRIGPGVAWCLDVTACLADRSGLTVGPLLRELTQAMRDEGLIPVTIERFS